MVVYFQEERQEKGEYFTGLKVLKIYGFKFNMISDIRENDNHQYSNYLISMFT